MDSSLISLQGFLDRKVEEYNKPDFIINDPIAIPHLFKGEQDIEIMGFFAAILAWGKRKTIINKCKELIQRMDGEPYHFVMNHKDSDLKQLLGFKHRTFNDTDLLYFISFLRFHYSRHDTLETAFLTHGNAISMFNNQKGSSNTAFLSVENSLNHFRCYFFSLVDFPFRTRKHISSPLQKSTCKRLNMFLRWMVRKDAKGVDFGIWNSIRPAALIAPCDVHVERVARHLGLITRKQRDWMMALELTAHLSMLDPIDPVKYDFALFGLGVEGEL